MNPLQSRKQLLIAESELNRAELAVDLTALAADVRALTYRAKSLALIASSAASLVAGLSSLRRSKSVDQAAKPSWLQTIFKGVGLVSNLWLTFRSRGREEEDQPPNSRD